MAEEQKAPKEAKAEEKVEAKPTLLDEIVQLTKLKPSDEAYSVTKMGLQAFIDALLKPGREALKVAPPVIDDIIADIDRKLSGQVDAILHHPDFQKAESSWRSLKFLIDRTNFRENIKVEVLNVSKEDLLADFEDAPEVPKSGLYRNVYTSEYGQFGGMPYGLMVGNYEFGPGPQDVKLLRYVAGVAAMSHAPFLSGVKTDFFGI